MKDQRRILQIIPDTVGTAVEFDFEDHDETGKVTISRTKEVYRIPGWALVQEEDGETWVGALDPIPDGSQLYLLDDSSDIRWELKVPRLSSETTPVPNVGVDPKARR